MTRKLAPLIVLSFLLCQSAQAAGEALPPASKDQASSLQAAAVPAKSDSPSAFAPPINISGGGAFPNPEALNDDVAAQLPGMCSLAELGALPEADRYVYAFDVWPSDKDSLGKKTCTFNFHLGQAGAASGQKIAFQHPESGPDWTVNLSRAKDPVTGRYFLKGIGNLGWGGTIQHTFNFDKPVMAFGVVLSSAGDVELKKFYWPGAKALNGYPVSYTLTDGTIINLGQRELRGALIKGGTKAFLGVIDRSGRGIVSVGYTLKGLAGQKAQDLVMDGWTFVAMPRPAVAALINLKSSHDFESPDRIAPSPTPALTGLAPLDDFRFIVGNKRYVYRFDTWPKTTKALGSEGVFAFDLQGKGNADQTVILQAANASDNAQLTQTNLRREDGLAYPTLGGLGDIGKGAWAQQTIKFAKPVRAFGITYRSTQDVKLAQTDADGKNPPVSYTLADGSVVNLGNPGMASGVMSHGEKTFVGVIDKTDKGIASATVRVRGSAAENQPLVIEDLAFALAGPPPGDWKLVLEDNFNGNKLNPAIWAPGYTFVDIINSELQGYVPENITVANGICTIKVERRECKNTDRDGRKGQTQKFASGAFTSYGKFTATYGYFEARIKMPHPRGAGIWPAFWMLPDRGKEYPPEIRRSYRTKNYGTGIEIDIFEFMPWWQKPDGSYPIHVGCIWSYGKVTEKDPAPHGYGGYAQDNNGWGPEELTYKNADTEFHTYGLYWSPERLIYFLDGKPIFRVKDPKHVPDVPHYFLFNVAVTGNGWGKSTDKKNPTMAQIAEDMPNSMEIDYFRVYSGTLDEAVPAAPTDNPAVIRTYAPPSKDAPAPAAPMPAPASTPTPAPAQGGAPAAPANSDIFTPSTG